MELRNFDIEVLFHGLNSPEECWWMQEESLTRIR